MVASIDERIARDALRECRLFPSLDDLSTLLVAIVTTRLRDVAARR